MFAVKRLALKNTPMIALLGAGLPPAERLSA
jgi:hypothetical protein